VGSQSPGIRRSFSPMLRRFVGPELPSLPCSSEARSQVAAGSSQTSGGPESKASAFRPASTMARSSVWAHHRRPDEEARLEGLGRRAVAVERRP
jgi:hypothetical protein